ncbi:tRNA intron endonuclease [Pilobolus umbonatus]|nr:tRNA intron endonuclease [Pilobolus umbonatus]
MDELIKVTHYGHKYFIFDEADVRTLRIQHRIIGTLTGTLPQFPMQTSFYGLPLLLSVEEIDLLLKRKVITLEHSPKISSDRSRIFHSLWSQGYYLTRGSKFGGDYMVYPNDPMCCHSQFIISICQYDQPILANDIISMGRLATTVKKTFVLMSLTFQSEGEEEEEDITAYSIEWAGF